MQERNKNIQVTLMIGRQLAIETSGIRSIRIYLCLLLFVGCAFYTCLLLLQMNGGIVTRLVFVRNDEENNAFE